MKSSKRQWYFPLKSESPRSIFLVGLLLLGTFLSTVKLADTGLSTDSSASAAYSIRLKPNKHLKRVLVVMFDSFLILIAYYGAYWLRFDLSELTGSQLALAFNSLPILLILSLIVFAGFGLYRQDWQYFGIIDLLTLVKSNLVAVLITIAVITYIFRFVGYSRSIFIIYWGTIVMLQATSRLSFRILEELLSVKSRSSRRVLIYGAGAGGVLLLRELINNEDLKMTPAGFLDDDPSLLGVRIKGVPVLGGFETIEKLVPKYDVSHIVLSTSNVAEQRLRAMKSVSSDLGLGILQGSVKFEELILK